MNKLVISSILTALLLSIGFSFVSDLIFEKSSKIKITEKEMQSLNKMTPDKAREYITSKPSKTIRGFEYIALNMKISSYWMQKGKTVPLSFLSIFLGCLIISNIALKKRNKT